MQIEIENLTFTYPDAAKPAIRNVSLSLESGSFTCVCGRSGCGKTTLIRHLKSALAPHGQREGNVLIDGTPLTEIPTRRQAGLIGFVMQRPSAQIVTDSALDELSFGLESIGASPLTTKLRVAEMASFFGMQDWLHESVHRLSGGQQQLLNIAATMTMEPEALVLDEPTSQLDPISATKLMDALRRVNIDLGTTIIIVEHDLENVLTMADKLVAMEAGEVVVHGRPRKVANELFAKEAETARMLPSPVRIFCAVERSGEGGETDAVPLNVREGRAWLKARLERTGNASEAGETSATGETPASALAGPAPAPTFAEPRPAPADANAASAANGKSNADTAPAQVPFPTEPSLQLRNVWLRYERGGEDVLRGISLEVRPRDILAIIGGNGAGKSTLLKAACGISSTHRGSVRILGKPLGKWDRGKLFRGGVAMLPQEPLNLFAKETVEDDLLEIGASKALVEEVVGKCDISGLMGNHPFDLSGGEVQRAALAKVLLCQPQVLLLDEPTKGLDAISKDELGGIISSLAGEGRAIVLASHDIEFCARFTTRVAMLFDGEVACAGSPHEVFAQNAFYTTATSRMSHGLLSSAITDEDVIGLCRR